MRWLSVRGSGVAQESGPWVPASAGMTGEVVGCSGEWTCLGVGAVGSRLRGNDERERESWMACGLRMRVKASFCLGGVLRLRDEREEGVV